MRFGYWVSAFTGTLLGGGMVFLLYTFSPYSETGDSAETPPPQNRQAVLARDLHRRIALLESRVSHLQMQIAIRPSPDVDDRNNSSTEVSVDTDDFLMAVEDAIDEIHSERRQEKEARKSEKRKKKSQELAAFFESRLALDANQKRVLADVLFNQYERYAQLKKEAQSNRSSDLLTPREKSERRQQLKRQVEIETEAALSEIFDDARLSHFVEIRDEEKLKPGG